MKIILEDLRIQIQGLIGIRCDNQAAISIDHSPVQHDRTEHVEIDRYFVKEKLEVGLNQVADILTKGLPAKRFDDLTNKLGMCDIHSPI